jgi:hypothetical protein
MATDTVKLVSKRSSLFWLFFPNPGSILAFLFIGFSYIGFSYIDFGYIALATLLRIE